MDLIISILQVFVGKLSHLAFYLRFASFRKDSQVFKSSKALYFENLQARFE